MIPARRKQLSLIFTTLLILSLFPYRTWDLHGIQATTLQPLAHWSVLQNYNDYLTLPTQTNTNPPPHYNNTTGKHVHPHHPPRRLRLPPLNLPRPRIPRFELRNLSPRQSNSYRLRPVRLFFPLPSLSSNLPPLTPPFFFLSRRFGSCYDFCAESRKEFPVPECNGVSDEVLICEYFKSDCGELFGGCYSNKGPIPGWAVPTCPPESEPSKPEPQTAPKQDPTCQICVDNINDCGA